MSTVPPPTHAAGWGVVLVGAVLLILALLAARHERRIRRATIHRHKTVGTVTDNGLSRVSRTE